MNDKIKELQKQIDAEKNIIAKCTHKWGDAFSNTETQREEYLTGEYETNGVHHHPLSAFRDKKVPRWTKLCTECGFEKHTYKQKPIVNGYEADF